MKNIVFSIFVAFIFTSCVSDDTSSTNQSNTLTSSKAMFSVVGDYLYTVNGSKMNIFDLTQPENPILKTFVDIAFDVETIFSYKQQLYLGASSGVYIYDITDPLSPTKISTFGHTQSCDPVVIADDIAYVTLNSSRSCFFGEDTNRLEIIDVEDPKNPTLIKSVDMYAPGGLGVSDNTLFICDSTAGLKAFDINKSIENNKTMVTLQTQDIISDECYDVIANDYTLVISNDTNIKQYDYAAFPMSKLSELE